MGADINEPRIFSSIPTPTLDEWFNHIKQIHHQRMELGLERVGEVADRLQLKTFSCSVITVGGTNGKGSCTKTLESIYHEAGYKTALYTSPHLIDFNERIRIQNHNISDEQLLCAFEAIEKARGDIILSFFEFITLAALFLFQAAKPDVMILEIGLGGRLDAVNMVESDVAIVTSIALDHTEYLGHDREMIAYEKASIARANKPFICGEENPPQNISKTIQEKNAVLFQIGRDFSYQLLEDDFIFSDNKITYRLPVSTLKAQNIATAIAAIQALQKKLPLNQTHIAAGIKAIQLAGRFEKVTQPFPMILDVAHNPHATEWMAEQYKKLLSVNKNIAVVGMLKDKAMIESIQPLLPLIQIWCICSLISENEERGSSGLELAQFLQKQGKIVYTFDTVDQAMDFLFKLNCQQECDRALIFGSFYTVAAAKRWLTEVRS